LEGDLNMTATSDRRRPREHLIESRPLRFGMRIILFALLAMTLVGYGLALRAADQGPLPLVIVSVLILLAGFLVREIRVQIRAAWRARSEAQRRWALLAIVSTAAQDMSSSLANREQVLETMIEAVRELGFPYARVFIREPDRWRTVPATGSPEPAIPDAIREAADAGRVDVFRGRTAGLPMHGAAVPFYVSDDVAAVLAVGTELPPGPTTQDLKVFRMLVSQASLALANVHRFEEQRLVIERLADLDHMKNDFLSTVSHELRTPLTVITGMGRTLEHQWDSLNEEIRVDFLTRLNANAATLDHVIGQLLDFSKLEAGQLRPDTREIDPSTLLPAVVDRVRLLLTNHTVELDVEPRLSIQADPGLIERVVENLLSNASKYTPAGSRVIVGARPDGPDHVVVAVSDDGPGIPGSELERIGERFFRGGDVHTRSTRGTGLGLAVVSEILELHGSRLEVESTVGKGTRFSFRLPRDRVTASAQVPIRRPNDPPGPRSHDVVSTLEAPAQRGERFETVMTAAADGVEWAISQLYREFHPAVLRYLHARGVRAPEAAAEKVWVDVGRGLHGFSRNEAAFRRWLFDLTRRSIEESGEQDSVVEIGDATTPMTEALAKVAALPPEHADILLLRSLGNLDVDDVAEITGQGPGAVRLLETDAHRWLSGSEEFTSAEAPSVGAEGLEPPTFSL